MREGVKEGGKTNERDGKGKGKIVKWDGKCNNKFTSLSSIST